MTAAGTLQPREAASRGTDKAPVAPRDDGESLLHFQASSHFEALFRAAIEATGIVVADSPVILVLGSGPGANAVAPCLRLFRGARIVATDRSPGDFAALSRHLGDSGAQDRVVCLQMEPEAALVEPQSFDLVTGVSILHRLVDPDRALASAARALKPGGHAIFMEPFDGYGIIRLAFERICAEADLRQAALTPATRSALQAIASDIAARTLPDPTQPHLAGLEQKWLFAREAIAAASRNLGFAEARFVTHNDHPSLYRDAAAVMLRLSTGLDAVELPDWAWAILDAFDGALTPAVKRLLMLEGSIVLTKGPDLH